MEFRRFAGVGAVLLAAAAAGCQPDRPLEWGDRSATAQDTPAAQERGPAAAGGAGGIDLAALARRPAGEESICQAFARQVARSAQRHGDDVNAFVAELQQEFIGGTDNPFDMKKGLHEGRWNQRYFYAGHGGFRSEYDDAQRYPDGGNHQPGHFISVLSVATQFGEEQARIAIAAAGDYEPGQEDDLRLSMVAIPLGAGLEDGSVTTAEVARQARQLCRS
jgi:hypothetical protein